MTAPALRYAGSDVAALLALAAAAHGLTVLPQTAVLSRTLLANTGTVAIPVGLPRLRHRTELIHGTLRDGSPAAALAALLTRG
jgi:hypothetical protein